MADLEISESFLSSAFNFYDKVSDHCDYQQSYVNVDFELHAEHGSIDINDYETN